MELISASFFIAAVRGNISTATFENYPFNETYLLIFISFIL